MTRTAFLFPGQGAQQVGMASELVQTNPAAKTLFHQASQILGYDLLTVCLQGPAERLNATDVSQPAIYVASLAALEQLKATTPETITNVVATAGLSLGEYTALTFAEAISFEDGLRVVQARGRAMQAAADASPSGMVAVIGLDLGGVESLISEARPKGLIEVANKLCPGNTVVSGSAEAIEEVCKIAESRNLRLSKLAVAGAFHTELMRPAVEQLAAVLDSAKLQTPRIPVWSNVDAKPHTDPAEIKQLLVQQVVSPVLWEHLQRGLLADSIERFYEIGPGRVLAGLLKRVHRKADIQNVQA
jgi:[acyl-carrier-protein] S-malonyltransferase